MRVFKPTYKVNGRPRTSPRWHVGFTDHLDVRRSIAATTDKAASEQFGRNIERLVAFARVKARPDRDLSRWLEGLTVKLRDKFASWGLLDEAASALSRPLVEHVDDLRAALLAKGRTPEHAQLCRTRLLELFDGCGFAYWRDLNVSRVERWLAERRRTGTKMRTSNHYVTVIKGFCAWMVAVGRAASSPLGRLTGVTVTDEESYGAFTVNQVRTLLQVTFTGPRRGDMTGPERCLLYRFAVETALRANEVRTLTRSSFKLDDDPPAVRVRARDAKSRREAEVPLRASLVAELRDHLAGKLPTADTFTVSRTIAAVLRADLIAAGLPTVDEDGRKLVFPSFRHTTGSWLSAEGVPLKVVQRVLRHSTFKLTADRYTHVERRAVAEALSKLPELRATGTADEGHPTYAPLPRAVAEHGRNRPVSERAADDDADGETTTKPRTTREKTDRAGFEPAVEVSPYAGLANRSLQPLGHLSGRSVHAAIVPPDASRLVHAAGGLPIDSVNSPNYPQSGAILLLSWGWGAQKKPAVQRAGVTCGGWLPIRSASRGQVRHGVKSRLLAVLAELGVDVHRELDRAVPHASLGDRRVGTATGQVRCTLDAKGVEIEPIPCVVGVRGIGSLQVEPQHVRRER